MACLINFFVFVSGAEQTAFDYRDRIMRIPGAFSPPGVRGIGGPSLSPPSLGPPQTPGCGGPFCFQKMFQMARFRTVGVSYGALRKECMEAIRQWPGCETVSGIQIIRDNTPSGFSVRVTLYGEADERIADRAMACVQREKRRHFHLME
jgi:hypothetical protein